MRRRSEDRPLSPRREHVRNGGGISQPTADPHRDPDGVDDPAHRVEIGRTALAGSVEIDHVQEARALSGPAECRVDGSPS